MSHLEEHNILTNDQHGFRKGHSCETQLLTTIEEIHRHLDKGQQTDTVILDFSKAYDTVPHQRLLMKLQNNGIRDEMNTWIASWLKNRCQSVVIDGEKSEEAQVRSGVPQGTVLGPLLFLLYINDIGNDLTSKIRLFADDSLLFGVVKTDTDSRNLQGNLNRLCEWADKWQMVFNPEKCYVLSIHRKKLPIVYDYSMKGKILKHVEKHQYLGVTIASDLNWKHHIESIVGKANRALGFIKRNLKHCPQEIKIQAYKTLVRPILEYSSTVWDPYMINQVESIEKVQRRAVRFATNFKEREPGCMTAKLKEINLPLLKGRREQARLALFRDTVQNNSAAKLPCYIMKRMTNTRQSNTDFPSFVHTVCNVGLNHTEIVSLRER